jgi:hypothetical protein
MEFLKAEAEKGPPPPGPLEVMRAKWDGLIGKTRAEETEPAPAGPQGPQPRMAPDVNDPR